MNKKKILSLILCCFMVLSVGCSSGSKLSDEQEQIAIECMEYSKYFFENGFVDSSIWNDEETYAKFGFDEDIMKVITHTDDSDFNDDMFNLIMLSKNLIIQRTDGDGVKKGDKETSEEYQNFVEKFNEVNEKYKLGFDEL